jgi:glucose-1-phosphate thymidylyltransferase
LAHGLTIVVLAAGYATRLYPLTLNRPKMLLPVGGRPMLEHLLDRLEPIEGVESAYVVTNAKFAGQFGDWAERSGAGVTIVDDGTENEETRLGAIGDLGLVIEREKLDGDLLVVAGDNLFSDTLEGFAEAGRAHDAPVLAVYDVGNLDAIRRYNAISVDGEGRIMFFEEKPERPTSTLTGIALYYYPRATLPLIRRYLDEGNNPDQPGRLVEWLYTRVPFYTWRVPGVWYDIGSKETLEQADADFRGRGGTNP